MRTLWFLLLSVLWAATLAQHQPLRAPDLLDRDPDFKPTLVGSDPNAPFPETEGYAPPNGYFSQTPECDALMRLWMDDCAFAEEPGSVYHRDPAKMFPTGTADENGRMKTSVYLGNLLKNLETVNEREDLSGKK